MMRAKIRSVIMTAHSSTINGIDSDKAATKMDIWFKSELENILDEFESALFTNTRDRDMISDLIGDLRSRYKIYA